MKYPTEQEIAQAKAISAERFGSADVILIELDEPIDRAFLVAPFDEKSWAKYVDAIHRDVITAHGQVYAERCVWPLLGELSEIRSAWPSSPSKIARQLAAEAGDNGEIPIVRRLSESTCPADLSRDEMAALVKQHAGAVLWAVEQPSVELSCVMVAPLPDVYLAAITADTDARKSGEGVVKAMSRYVKEAIAWPPTMGAVLSRRPALIGDLRSAYRRMGGEGAAVRSKRL